MVQQMLAIWSLVPLAFLNPAWTSGSSRFMYYWSLAWRILSITLLACEMSAIVQYFEHSLACLSLRFEWNLTFSSPVATAEFSKFAGILNAALSQHHFFRIWNSSTGIPSPPLAFFVVRLPKAHLTSHSTMSGSRWVITPSWLSGSWRYFLYSSSVYSCLLFLISSASGQGSLVGCCLWGHTESDTTEATQQQQQQLLGPYHFCPLLCPCLNEMFPWYL